MSISPEVTLMPHAVCWSAAPRLVWTMVVTNAITFLSYTSICATLLYMTRKTRLVIARDWMYFAVGFALFIVACGSTHLLEVITTWSPIFWVDAWTNIVTAVLSAWVAVQLIRRASVIAFSMNDYARRLDETRDENLHMQESLLAARKLEDWSKMTAAVSHEISNPLETIGNLLYLIRQSEGAGPEVQDFAARAADEVDKVVDISRSTLNFFRQATEPEPIDLRAAADAVAFMLVGLERSRNVDLRVASEGNVVVQAFPGETRQVLLNLVRNACEATQDAAVTVSLCAEDAGVRIVVEDEGIGIAEEALPKLFEFGRTTKGPAGNGIGLWTVKHIVEKHGGHIDVRSKAGEGTRFTVWWPRVVEA